MSSLIDLNSKLNKSTLQDSKAVSKNTNDKETSKIQESNPQVAPSLFQNFERASFQSNPLSHLSQCLQPSQSLNQLGSLDPSVPGLNAILPQLGMQAGMIPLSDLVLQLKSKILLDLFHNAFKRYLHSVKGDLARNFSKSVPQSPLKDAVGILQPRTPNKIQRKYTDLMSSETIEESDAVHNKKPIDKVSHSYSTA